MAETFVSGASTSAIARCYGVAPSHLFTWRRQARDGQRGIPADDDAAFAPMIVEEAASLPRSRDDAGDMLEIVLADAIVRLPLDIAPLHLAAFIRTLLDGS